MGLQSSEDLDDESLMARIVKGEHQAFSILVRRHTDKFYGLSWRIIGDGGAAEDVVQEAFLKLWQNPRAFQPARGTRFTTWFYRVVVNLSLDHLRRRGHGDVSESFDHCPDPAKGAEADLADRQFQDKLNSAIYDLPEKQRLALTLCFYEGLSNRDAAQVMGIGLKALESLLMRAKSGLRDRLEQAGLIEAKKEDHHARRSYG